VTPIPQGEKNMKHLQIIILCIVTFVLAGCSSSQDKAYKAQEGVHKQRLELVDKYQKCMEEAGDDAMKADGCEQYLKAADALK
jgi:outer membrane biogenesis lipoprotein LolB